MILSGDGSFDDCARAAASKPLRRRRSRSVLDNNALICVRGDGACARARGVFVIMGSKTLGDVRPLTPKSIVGGERSPEGLTRALPAVVPSGLLTAAGRGLFQRRQTFSH